jgi:aminomethyltransferase
LEAGIGWVIAWDKGDFMGKAALLSHQEKGLSRKMVGLILTESGIPREGYSIWNGDGNAENVGRVTSGTVSPTLGKGIALAYVDVDHSQRDRELWVDIRGTRKKCRVVNRRFYQRKKV